MEQVRAAVYRQVSMLSVLILVVLTLGFYRTYIVFFPVFEGFQFVQHFHGATMLLWLACLIAQPLLISQRKFQIHKWVGKLSYVIAPILVISIFLVSKMVYHRTMGIPSQTPQDALALMALSVPSLFAFSTVYGLAIANKRNTYQHMRYMIGTALLMIGPGLGRALIVYFEIPFPIAVAATDYTVLAIAIALLAMDIFKKRSYSAFLTVMVVLFISHLAWAGKYGRVWQTFASGFADTLF